MCLAKYIFLVEVRTAPNCPVNCSTTTAHHYPYTISRYLTTLMVMFACTVVAKSTIGLGKLNPTRWSP